MKKIDTALVGVTHENEDGVHRQRILGYLYDQVWTEGYEYKIKIELRHEPDNPADENAIGVWITAPRDARGRVGFVPAEHASGELGDAVRGDRIRDVRFKKMETTKGGGVWSRLLVKVSAEEDELLDEDGNVYELD